MGRVGARVQVGEREDKVGFFPSENIPIELEQKSGGKAKAAKEVERKSNRTERVERLAKESGILREEERKKLIERESIEVKEVPTSQMQKVEETKITVGESE